MLRIDGDLAAVRLGFVLGDTYEGYQSGFDARFAQCSPSHWLRAKSIETSIAEGLTRFNMGAVAEYEYKVEYFTGRRPVGRLVIGKTGPSFLIPLGRELCLNGWRQKVKRWLKR